DLRRRHRFPATRSPTMDESTPHDPAVRSVDRRTLLRDAAAALPLAYLAPTAAAAQPAGNRPAFPGLILRQRQPDNLEFPFPTLDSFIIPPERFFVRSHFAVPRLDIKTWRLRVEGAVAKPLELTFDELRKMPSRGATVLLECSGNSRVFLSPK